MQKARCFQRPALLTLTVDRSHFGSPREAFVAVTVAGLIRRLMRLLGVERWCWVLELQMESGEGWPHWHLVVDLPPLGLDLKLAWRLWRDKWGFGHLDLRERRRGDPEHPLGYVTKFLVRYPPSGFPRWIDTYNKRIRWVGASGAVGPIRPVRERLPSEEVAADEPQDAKKPKAVPHRSYALRKAECGRLVNCFRETADGHGIRRRFLGRLPRELCEAGCGGPYGLTLYEDDRGWKYVIGEWETLRGLRNDLLWAAGRWTGGPAGNPGRLPAHRQRPWTPSPHAYRPTPSRPSRRGRRARTSHGQGLRRMTA